MDGEPTGTQLLARLRQDTEALRAFYLRHVGGVTRFLARRCRTPDDLADAVAQTFVEVIGSAPRYDAARGNATAWLFGIAAHTASAQWRDQQRAAGIAVAVLGRRLLDEDDYARLGQGRRARPPVVARASALRPSTLR